MAISFYLNFIADIFIVESPLFVLIIIHQFMGSEKRTFMPLKGLIFLSENKSWCWVSQKNLQIGKNLNKLKSRGHPVSSFCLFIRMFILE